MPSQSKSQHRLMAMSCEGNGPVPRKTACEFMHADKGKVKDMPEKLSDLKKKKGSRWAGMK
jgi:hypothetical protein